MFILKASEVHGIGVFTTKPLLMRELADVFDPEDGRFVSTLLIKDDEIGMFETYGIATNGGFYAPLDFRRMSVGWYLNHSDTPNLVPNHDHTEYFAARDIEEGEELTIDYGLLDGDVDNSL